MAALSCWRGDRGRGQAAPLLLTPHPWAPAPTCPSSCVRTTWPTAHLLTAPSRRARVQHVQPAQPSQQGPRSVCSVSPSRAEGPTHIGHSYASTAAGTQGTGPEGRVPEARPWGAPPGKPPGEAGEIRVEAESRQSLLLEKRWSPSHCPFKGRQACPGPRGEGQGSCSCSGAGPSLP